MELISNINKDLSILKEKYKSSKLLSFITNRGFHALLFYRFAHLFYDCKIPLLPLVLTRIIQIIYSIDIDYRAKLEGGIVIIHGVGLVIGAGVVIKKNVILYHQVTLGIKGAGRKDGFPTIEKGCILGAGAKLFGAITIGEDSVIGANVVVTEDIDRCSLVKTNSCIIKKLNPQIN